jgi:regulator of telomere elongation helicase 1
MFSCLYSVTESRTLQCLNADEWYLLEATRAVNQAIGRVIRHKNDYGAILLCDQRFEGPSFQAALSSWVRPHIKKHGSFGSMIRELRQFFVNAEKTVSQHKRLTELRSDQPSICSFE